MHLFWGREAYLGFYVGECSRFQKYWWWANQMTHFKEEGKKKTIGASITNLIEANKYLHTYNTLHA
jgi:hypothetical protein